MSFNRMPLFLFAQLAAAFGLLFALPTLSLDATYLFLDRNVGTTSSTSSRGGSTLLWQHLFWIFAHPEVYILIVPAFGIATSIIPTFTRRKMVAFPLVAIAELLVVFIGFGVWAHHMFATGLPTISLAFFAAATGVVVIPSALQVFAWCMSFVTGSAEFRTPLLFIAGFIFMFVAGGLTGIMFLAVPFDQQVTDTYFVVAHFHYIIFGAAVFPIFGGMYYWFPKLTGRHVPRAAGTDQLLGDLCGDEPPVLPDAHRRPARACRGGSTPTPTASAGRSTTCSRRSAAS